MSTNGIAAFDATLQKTQHWLRQIMDELGTDRSTAFAVLRGTLHAIRDRLPDVEAAHLGAQLPLLIRGLYYEGYSPGMPTRDRHLEEFMDHIRDEVRRDDIDVNRAARVVIKVLADHVSEGAVKHVRELMPKQLRELWPAA